MLTCLFVGDVMPGSKKINEKPHAEILEEFRQQILYLATWKVL